MSSSKLPTTMYGNPAARTGDSRDARSDARVKRQRAWLAARRGGATTKQASAAAGVSESRYAQWRQSDPQFRAEADVAAVHGKNPDKLGERPKSFVEFRKKYFGFDTYPHQQLMVDTLDQIAPREIVLINIWPEAGKTTTAEDWICKVLGEDPNRRITDVSQSADLCIKTAQRLKDRMTDTMNFGSYIADYGPFHEEGQGRRNTKPWANTHFTVDRNDTNERDYSFQARAISSRVYGTRIDDLLVDDVQAWETLTQTKKIVDQLRRTYWNRGKNMRTAILGTRLARGDVYEALLDAGLVTKRIIIPAVQPDGTITCPELWGWDRDQFETEEEFMVAVRERVALARTIATEDGWFASYQQMPSANELATFNDDMLDAAKDHGRTIGAPTGLEYVVLSLDPALGGGNALTAAVHGPEKFEVIDQHVTRSMSSTEDILADVADFARKYHPQLVIVERDAQQSHIIEDTRAKELEREYGFQIIPHTTSRNKADPIFGVSSMAGSFMKREIRIPYGDDETRQKMDLLLGQLRSWRGDLPTKMVVQDAVMSLWFSWRYWKQNLTARQHADDYETQWKRPGMPYAPTGAR